MYTFKRAPKSNASVKLEYLKSLQEQSIDLYPKKEDKPKSEVYINPIFFIRQNWFKFSAVSNDIISVIITKLYSVNIEKQRIILEHCWIHYE